MTSERQSAGWGYEKESCSSLCCKMNNIVVTIISDSLCALRMLQEFHEGRKKSSHWGSTRLSDYGVGSQLTGDFAPDTLCPCYLLAFPHHRDWTNCLPRVDSEDPWGVCLCPAPRYSGCNLYHLLPFQIVTFPYHAPNNRALWSISLRSSFLNIILVYYG